MILRAPFENTGSAVRSASERTQFLCWRRTHIAMRILTGARTSYNFSGPIMLQWHVMDRREFVKQVGLGLAAGWAVGRLSWPFNAWAAGPELRLALLADAHLKDGNDRRPEALALARAVAEIRGLSPPPDSGALRRRPGPPGPARRPGFGPGNPRGPARALLGGAGGRGSRPGGKSAWVRRWGEPWFSRSYRGCQVMGLDTAWRRTPADRSLKSGRPNASGWPGS